MDFGTLPIIILIFCSVVLFRWLSWRRWSADVRHELDAVKSRLAALEAEFESCAHVSEPIAETREPDAWFAKMADDIVETEIVDGPPGQDVRPAAMKVAEPLIFGGEEEDKWAGIGAGKERLESTGASESVAAATRIQEPVL